ncbi:MAG: sulfotransferase [Flavobacteriales bacterium]|nr:sulfotransferase [Flavobacteriales bacterium]
MEADKVKLHFILSKERSGSTLLSAMLNKSPNVVSVIEETFSFYLYPKYGRVDFWTDQLVEEFYQDFILLNKQSLGDYYVSKEDTLSSLLSVKDRYYDYLTMCKYLHLHFLMQKKDASVIVDKQLEYLFFFSEMMELFPDSKIVVLTRDPRDNVEACVRRKLGKDLNVVYQSALWNDYYQEVLKYGKSERVIDVKYEDLIRYPEKVLRVVSDHFGIEYNRDMLLYSNSFSDVKQGNIQNKYVDNMEGFQDGLTRGLDLGNIGKYKSAFTETEIRKIESVTRKNAAYFGYEFEDLGIALSLGDKLKIWKAKIQKKWLMKIYKVLPVWVKIGIKKFKRKVN